MQRALCMVAGHRWERDADDFDAYPLFHCTRCGKHKEFPMAKALEPHRGVRGAVQDVGQIVGCAAVIAAIGGLIGFLVVHQAARGFGWGMIVAGGAIGLVTGRSGSPSANLRRGRWGAAGNYWSESSALPQSPLQVALGALLAFAAGFLVIGLSGL